MLRYKKDISLFLQSQNGREGEWVSEPNHKEISCKYVASFWPCFKKPFSASKNSILICPLSYFLSLPFFSLFFFGPVLFCGLGGAHKSTLFVCSLTAGLRELFLVNPRTILHLQKIPCRSSTVERELILVLTIPMSCLAKGNPWCNLALQVLKILFVCSCFSSVHTCLVFGWLQEGGTRFFLEAK